MTRHPQQLRLPLWNPSLLRRRGRRVRPGGPTPRLRRRVEGRSAPNGVRGSASATPSMSASSPGSSAAAVASPQTAVGSPSAWVSVCGPCGSPFRFVSPRSAGNPHTFPARSAPSCFGLPWVSLPSCRSGRSTAGNWRASSDCASSQPTTPMPMPSSCRSRWRRRAREHARWPSRSLLRAVPALPPAPLPPVLTTVLQTRVLATPPALQAARSCPRTTLTYCPKPRSRRCWTGASPEASGTVRHGPLPLGTARVVPGSVRLQPLLPRLPPRRWRRRPGGQGELAPVRAGPRRRRQRATLTGSPTARSSLSGHRGHPRTAPQAPDRRRTVLESWQWTSPRTLSRPRHGPQRRPSLVPQRGLRMTQPCPAPSPRPARWPPRPRRPSGPRRGGPPGGREPQGSGASQVRTLQTHSARRCPTARPRAVSGSGPKIVSQRGTWPTCPLRRPAPSQLFGLGRGEPAMLRRSPGPTPSLVLGFGRRLQLAMRRRLCRTLPQRQSLGHGRGLQLPMEQHRMATLPQSRLLGRGLQLLAHRHLPRVPAESQCLGLGIGLLVPRLRRCRRHQPTATPRPTVRGARGSGRPTGRSRVGGATAARAARARARAAALGG